MNRERAVRNSGSGFPPVVTSQDNFLLLTGLEEACLHGKVLLLVSRCLWKAHNHDLTITFFLVYSPWLSTVARCWQSFTLLRICLQRQSTAFPPLFGAMQSVLENFPSVWSIVDRQAKQNKNKKPSLYLITLPFKVHCRHGGHRTSSLARILQGPSPKPRV